MFKRKIYNKILKWKQDSNGKSALLIEGQRRVGKSTVVEEFARNEYGSYILIDFSNCSSSVRDLFDDMSDLNYFFMMLQLYYHTDLIERNSVIIFDEVQLCPRARQAIKHLVKDGRYDYIETGSLISIHKNVKDILKQNEKKFRLLYVGKIEPRRNVYFLVDLFISLEKEYPETELIIVGDGEKKYVQNFLDEISPYIKAGKIRYFKRATQKELVSVYKNSNLFIFTSNYEIFGMVLLEAMYFGLPVISSMNGGASVLIQEDKNGYIMQGFQIELWKERIVEIMRDYEKYKRMKESAHQRVVDKFLWDKLADQFIKGYQEAIELFKRQ